MLALSLLVQMRKPGRSRRWSVPVRTGGGTWFGWMRTVTRMEERVELARQQWQYFGVDITLETICPTPHSRGDGDQAGEATLPGSPRASVAEGSSSASPLYVPASVLGLSVNVKPL